MPMATYRSLWCLWTTKSIDIQEQNHEGYGQRPSPIVTLHPKSGGDYRCLGGTNALSNGMAAKGVCIQVRALLSGRYTPQRGGEAPASQLFQPSLPPPPRGCTRMGSSLPPAKCWGKIFEGVFLCTMRFSFPAQPSLPPPGML